MKKWILSEQKPDLALEFSKVLKISPTVSQILINRGITNIKEAEVFLAPKLMNLRDPFDIPDMRKGVERILLAVSKKEKVAVYGDYDVDGVTGTTILFEALGQIGLSPIYYIPSRYGEGYSLNLEAVKKLKKAGVNLILTVDCGISSFIEIEEANALGMDVIVTDHHNIPKQLPNAVALIDPKLLSNDHPSKDLSGAGVAFKFAWALLRAAGISENSFLTSLLDLAALGTIADVVPLTRENRIISKQGMTLLRDKKRPGIKALADSARLKNELTVRDINFGIAPRLNAAGRLEHASIAVNLLISKDPESAKKLADELTQINTKRQGIGEKIFKEVFAKIDSEKLYEDKMIIVSGNDWNPGVIGIIASRVTEKYNRPVALIGLNEGSGRGSARSIEGFNVFRVLESCTDLFKDFGGHAGAAGFEIDPENIPELKRRLLEIVESMNFEFTPIIHIDYELDPSKVSLNTVQEIKILDPFGEGNPPPIFSTKDAVAIEVNTVGSNNAHFKAKFSFNGSTFEVIGFGMGEFAKTVKPNGHYDIAYSLSTNIWNGFETVQFNLHDIIIA